MNRGTMGDHMITIDLNGGTGGPSYMKILLRLCSYKRLNAVSTLIFFFKKLKVRITVIIWWTL